MKSGPDRWIAGWKRNGWRTSAKQPVKNADLWRELAAATAHQDDNASEAFAKVKADHTSLKLKALLEEFKAEAVT